MRGREKAPDLQDETFGEVVVTDQEHKERLDRYSRAKAHQKTVVEYISDIPDLSKEYKQLSVCGEYLIFQKWLKTNFRKLVGGFSCKKHLLCNPCAMRRDSRQIRDYTLKIEHVLSENPGLIPVLITRTVKNGPDLSERYGHIVDIHKVLMQHRRQSVSNSTSRGKNSDTVMQYVAGSVGTYEFKRGENSGQWHPHIHEVAFLEPVFDFTPEEDVGWRKDDDGEWEKYTRIIHVPLEFRTRLSQEYLKISGDSFIVDVRRIDIADFSTLDQGELSDFTEGEGSPDQLKLVKALCEVFKYALKFSEMTVEDQVHAYGVLKGRRLIFSYGCLRGVKVPDNLVDKAKSELEVGPYVYELYKSYKEGYGFLNLLSPQEFEDLQEAAALRGRMENLRRREERLEGFGSLLLENGLRIDQGYVDKSGLESFWSDFSLPRMGHDLDCRSAINDQMLDWQKCFIPF